MLSGLLSSQAALVFISPQALCAKCSTEGRNLQGSRQKLLWIPELRTAKYGAFQLKHVEHLPVSIAMYGSSPSVT